MKKQNASFISPMMMLNSTNDKGLVIKWNFAGIISESNCQTYQIFVMVGQKVQWVKQFLTIYYKNMKLGELLGLWGKNIALQKREKIEWYEKTGFEMDQDIFQASKFLNNLQEVHIQQLAHSVRTLNGLISINYVFEQYWNKQDIDTMISALEQKILLIRSNNSKMDKIIFNIIYPNKIQITANCNLGVNYFSYSSATLNESIIQMIDYLKLIVIKKLRVRVHLNNGTYFKISNNYDWKNLDAPYIQRVCYGVPACSFKQNIIFLVREGKSEINMDLSIEMDIELYNEKRIKAKKEYEYATQTQWARANSAIVAHDKYGSTKLSNKKIILSNLFEKYSYIWVFMEEPEH